MARAAGLQLTDICIQAAANGPYWRLQRRLLEILPEDAANKLLTVLLANGALDASGLELFWHSASCVRLGHVAGQGAEWMAALPGFWHLRELDLAGASRLRDAWLSLLTAHSTQAQAAPECSPMHTLTRLSLRGCAALSVRGLEQLGSLTALADLDISETGARGPCPSLLHDALKPLTALTRLEAGGLHLSDACLASITAFTNIRMLGVWGAELSDSGLLAIASLPRLTDINLAWTRVHSLPALPALTSLNMDHCDIHEVWWAEGDYRISHPHATTICPSPDAKMNSSNSSSNPHRSSSVPTLSLSRLSLSHASISHSALHGIQRLLRSCTSCLESLDMTHGSLATLEPLMDATRLASLNLACTPVAAHGLAQGELQWLQACSSLTRLIMPTSSDAVALDGNHTGIATTSTPPAQLHTGPGQRPLAGLGPGHTENGSLLPADCLLPLTWLPKLQVLDLSGSGVGDAGLALLLQQASALTSLALDGCRNISGQAWTASHQASPASCETTHEPAAPAAAAQIAEGAWAPATALTGAPATTSLTGHPVAASTSCSQHASQGTRPASPCAVVRLSLLNTGLSASGLRELCLPLSSIQRQRPMGQFTEQADQLNVSASASGSHGCLSALPEHTLPCAAPLLGNVAVLRLCATQVDTGAALLPLCSLPQLSNLTLQALSARGEALLVLRKAPSLRRVDLFGCPLVTRAAASALLDASNTCRVVQLDGAVLWPESIAGAGTVKQGTAGLRSLGKPATQVATMVKADEGLRGQRVSAGGGHLAKFDQRRRYTRHELQELQPHCDSAGRCVLSKLLLENLEGWMLKSGEDEKW